MPLWTAVWILPLAGVLLVTYTAVIARRRRRNAIVITDFTPAELAWQDGPPVLNAFGATAYSRAIARNAAHQVLPPANQPVITYTSGTTANVTVGSSTGLCTAVANGTSVITAASTGLTSITQTATVSQVAASITVSPTTFSIQDSGASSTQQLTATVKDANSNTIAGASVAWSSDAPSTATVNSSGLVTGQAPGTVHITASSGGFSATSTGTVTHATVAPSPGANDYTHFNLASAFSGITNTAGLNTWFGQSPNLGSYRYVADSDGAGTKAIGGDLTAWTTTTLTNPITTTGSQTITVGSTTGFAGGDTIAIGDNDHATITSITNGTQLVCSPNLTHSAGVTIGRSVDAGTFENSKKLTTSRNEVWFTITRHFGRTASDSGATAGTVAPTKDQFALLNPHDQASFGLGNSGIKLWYAHRDAGGGTADSNSRMYLKCVYAGSPADQGSFHLTNDASTSPVIDYGPNTANPAPTGWDVIGHDLTYIVHFIASTGTAGTQGNADGTFQMWMGIDGATPVLTHDYRPALGNGLALWTTPFLDVTIDAVWHAPAFSGVTYDKQLEAWEPGVVPGTPSLGTASVGAVSGQATIPVTPATGVSGNGVPTTLRFYVWNGSSFAYDAARDFTCTGDTRGVTQNVTLSGFTDGALQKIKVTAVNGLGESSQSTELDFTTTAPSSGIPSDYALHVVATSGTNTTTNGLSVTSWTDQSSNGYVFTNPGAAPTYLTSGPNGKPAVRFTGGAYLKCASVPNLAGTDGTLVIVANSNATSASDQVVAAYVNMTGGAGMAIFRENNGASNNRWAGRIGNGTTSANMEVVMSVATGTFYNMVLAASGTGSPQDSFQAGGTSAAASSQAYTHAGTDGMSIGAYPNGTNAASTDVAEVYFWPRRLTATEITNTVAALHTLYATN